MELSTRRFADVIVAEAAGRIDYTNAEDFKSALWRALEQNRGEHGSVVIDFSRVDYISSVGLRVLMLAAKEMNGGERKITIAAPSPVVREIIAISRFHLILGVFASVREALEQLSPAALAAHDAAPAGGPA
jgi:anti-sigma B factor antagonist/stage II sporulation protein AA (anti-sigma F factor antagonist)